MMWWDLAALYDSCRDVLFVCLVPWQDFHNLYADPPTGRSVSGVGHVL